MAIQDDNPQVKIKCIEFIDSGNANTPFIRNYVYDECGELTNTFDILQDGTAYTVTGPIQKENAGTTILDLGDLETVTTFVDNGNNTATYTSEDGTQTTVTLGGGGGGVTDHGALTGLGDDDHTQYLTEARHDALPQDNPHSVTATQIGLGNVPNIDATLRSNHTGTQSASTISNFDAEVTNNVSVAANTSKVSFPEAPTDGQTYGRNNSTWQVITGGADPLTTVLTGLTTAITAANTAAVVATDTILSAIGKLQARTALLFYAESAINTTGLINNTTAEADFLILNATTPLAGDYEIKWAATWSGNDGAQDNIIRFYAGGNVVWTNIQEPKDVAGPGITLPNTTGGTSNSGTNQRHNFSMFDVITLPAGTNEIKITIDSSANGDLQTIYKGVVSIKKWGLS